MIQYFLLVIFLGFFSYLAWRNLVWAIAFMIAFLPSYLLRFSMGPLPMTLLEVMILTLFFVWLIRKKGKIIPTLEKMKTAGWRWLIFAWLAFATISLFVSPDLRAAAGIWKSYFIEPTLFLIVFVDTIQDKKSLKLIFYALGLSAFYVSIFAIYQKFTGAAIPNPTWQAEETRRVTSFYGYPNAVGLYLAPIVTLYVGWLISKFQILNFSFQKILTTHFKLIIFQLSVIILSSLAIIFARSEGAYVGILAGLFFLGVTNKKLRWPTVTATAILAVIIFSAPIFRDYVKEQITFQNDSGKVRISQWQETWQMIRDRPLSGAGLSGYQENFAPYHRAKHIEIYLYPHNLFLNFWSELGLGGLIVFLLITIKFFKDNIVKLRVTRYALPIFLMAVMITILVHGLVDVPYFKNDLAIFFWLVIGLSFINIKKSDNYFSLDEERQK